MKEQQTSIMHYRFTAYLETSVVNKRARYLKNKNCLKEQEYIMVDLLDKNCTCFDVELDFYIREKLVEDLEKSDDLLKIIGEDRLLRAIASLKERERILLFGRVFGELEFSKLGKKLTMTPKQAEMAYYYVIRKIRKKLEEKKDEF